MTSIIYIGMDVHTTNYTLCCYTVDSDDAFAVVNVKPDYHEILKYMERVRSTRGGNCDFICGYEAGCLGYSLYHQLAKHGVACIILAPSTMPQQKGNRLRPISAMQKILLSVWPSTCTARYMFRRPRTMPSKSIFECGMM